MVGQTLEARNNKAESQLLSRWPGHSTSGGCVGMVLVEFDLVVC